MSAPGDLLKQGVIPYMVDVELMEQQVCRYHSTAGVHFRFAVTLRWRLVKIYLTKTMHGLYRFFVFVRFGHKIIWLPRRSNFWQFSHLRDEEGHSLV